MATASDLRSFERFKYTLEAALRKAAAEKHYSPNDPDQVTNDASLCAMEFHSGPRLTSSANDSDGKVINIEFEATAEIVLGYRIYGAGSEEEDKTVSRQAKLSGRGVVTPNCGVGNWREVSPDYAFENAACVIDTGDLLIKFST